MTTFDLAGVDFAKAADGLVPAIVQDADTLQVLMLAYMDRAALAETLESGEATFYSRSRQARWRKGESSGHRMTVRSVHLDCDGDTILLRVTPLGPACHLLTATCFGDALPLGVGQLAALERVVDRRAREGGEGRTARLFAKGPKRIAQKVGEEGVECALAGAAGDAAELQEEAADLLYHLLVLLRARDVSLNDVTEVLARRAVTP